MADTTPAAPPEKRAGNRGKGRKPGVPNKLTKTVREAFERAFEVLQGKGTASLEKWAQRYPTEFYKLAARLIPTEINATVNTTLSEKLIGARKRTGTPAPAVVVLRDEDLA